MDKKKLVIFLDSGDTIINENTEVKTPQGIVLRAQSYPEAPEALRSLYENGFRLCMVADGYFDSFETVYHQLNLYDYFEQRVYSEIVGVEKPDAAIFRTALQRMGLTEADCGRVMMVGNNLARDVKGANQMGIHSVFIDQSSRYPKETDDPAAQPEFIIHSMADLLPLALQLEETL